VDLDRVSRAYAWQLKSEFGRALADFREAQLLEPNRDVAEAIERIQRKLATNTNPPSARASIAAPAPLTSGSGFFVTQTGHILTNAHVVNGCEAIAIKPKGDAEIAARIVATNKNDDLAILKVDRRVERVVPLRAGRPPRAGETVVVFGFPLSGVLASTGNATTGIITALAGLRDDPHLLQISAPVQPGNSGGPVLDASGHLVAIVVGKLDSLRVVQAIRDIPQNVNFAIKASTAADFLDAHGISYTSGPDNKETSIPDIVDQARDFSVQVLCTTNGSRPF
jgi:S1-C subfamily serine protease